MVPLEKQAIAVVRQNKVGVDTTYEPPLRVGFGISDKTVDLAHAVMGAPCSYRERGRTQPITTPITTSAGTSCPARFAASRRAAI
jgi:hypothetical protein